MDARMVAPTFEDVGVSRQLAPELINPPHEDRRQPAGTKRVDTPASAM